MRIRVGSRASELAVVQANIVIETIQKAAPSAEVELVTMTTTGDRILDQTLDKVGGKGLFVKELDIALLENRVDITVHSYKDVPMDVHHKLPIIAVSKREKPFDVLVLPKGVSRIDESKPIGCSSARRQLQIKKLYSGISIAPVRGNVITRLKKLDSGEFSALVLAEAGLARLGLSERISRRFSYEEMLPAACQGVLAVQAREGFDVSLLGDFPDEETWDVSVAERAFVRALGGGCSAPTAACGVLDGASLKLTGLFVNNRGALMMDTVTGSRKDAQAIGGKLANKIAGV